MSASHPYNPLVSVLTPSYNQGPYIRETLESVKRQTYSNFEHIVMDGGSTDETVAILKEYPEVKWTSEPDHGQADALNKALRLAKGEIIAWINSDDFYEPNALELAVKALENSPIAMGRCLIFEEGKGFLYTVQNFGRTWFDLLKYWIAYSIPTQPAIFFRRAVLDGIARHDAEYVDPHLHYCMDYDLWLRIAASHPLTTRIDAVTSHYRFTQTNKTSATRPMLSYAGAEMSAVFRRAEAMTGASRQVSYIIYADEPSAQLSQTVQSLLAEGRLDIEIIIATGRVTKPLREFIEEINARQEAAKSYRFVFPIASTRESPMGRIADAINRCAGRIISVLPLGTIAATDLSAQFIAAFQEDRLGMILPYAGSPALVRKFNEAPCEHPEQLDASFNSILFADILPLAFAIRRAAWLEGPGMRDDSHPLRELKRLVFSHLRQGWHLRMTLPTLVTLPDSALQGCSTTFGQFTGAELIVESEAVIAADPFWETRNGYKLCLRFSNEVLEKTRQLIAQAPEGWQRGEI